MILSIEINKHILSSQSKIYKTEQFIRETRHYLGMDKFLTKVFESLLNSTDKLLSSNTESMVSDSYINCYKLTTIDGLYTFYIRFGQQLNLDLKLNKKDIIFFRHQTKNEQKRRNDQSLINYLNDNTILQIQLEKAKDLTPKSQFHKLYCLSHAEYINFPLLSKEQYKIVTTENQNMLVQGVAGSGKTNICINKIVFTACRAYAGKVLYTTFSRGLLIDTKQKIQTYIQNLTDFVQDYNNNKIIFLDTNHKKAIENRLGIYFAEDDGIDIIEKVQEIIHFLEKKVDYLLLEDIHKEYLNEDIKVVYEDYFFRHYTHKIKNHQLAMNLQKIKHLSYEVIFKEIYGLIGGRYNLDNPTPMLSLKEYINIRQESLSKRECQTIHLVAKDYYNHLKNNNLWDNNLISKRLLNELDAIPKYSLAIIDEVQDMTEINLYLMKQLALKLFCVGDALQMINPSYFSFSYIKRLLYQKDIVSVAELVNNYRNSKKIEKLIDQLGKINIQQFGTHSFVLKGKSIETSVPTSTSYIKDHSFISTLSKQNFDDYTVVVANTKEKEKLRKLLKKQEILTVAEIKGLERDTVILYNILTDSIDKWRRLERTLINRKIADENSVYRYYFNLFYVGVSRAKNHLYVVEELEIPLFTEFFNNNFDNLSTSQALSSLNKTVSKMEDDQEEIIRRINEFVKLGQFDNARFAANKLLDDIERTYHLNIIEIYERHILHGEYRQAGIEFWEKNMLEEAKKQFQLSKDQTLIDLIDACNDHTYKGLNIDILQFYTDVQTNKVARQMILKTAENDLASLKIQNKEIKNKLNPRKERKHG